jgi:hypothetical protein
LLARKASECAATIERLADAINDEEHARVPAPRDRDSS